MRIRKRGWAIGAIAQSSILNTTIHRGECGNGYVKRGYESMEVYYQKVSPMFNCLSRFLAENGCLHDSRTAIGISGGVDVLFSYS